MRDLTFDIRARDRTQRAFDQARNNGRRFNREIDRTTVGMRAAATAARAFAAAFTVTAVTGFVRGIRDVVAEASKIGKVADRVGVSVEALQELRFGFELAGVAASQTDMGLQRFSRRVAQAANGSGELHEILKANNVELRNADGTMRSQVAILRDYAELIKNAGSEQEQLLLAFKAFDSEGAAMVNALRGGASALDHMSERAAAAGGVLEEELVRKAEEIDDEFNILWRNFEMNAKGSILSAVSYLDQMHGKLNELGNSSIFQRLAELAGVDGAVFVPGEGVFKEGDQDTPSSRVAKAFQGEQAKADAALVEALRERYGAATKEATKTVLPDPRDDDKKRRRGSGGGGGISIDRYQQVIDRLEHEKRLLGETALQQKILNAQRQAGVDAASAQGQVIAQKITAIESEREALKRLEDQQRANIEAAEFMGGMLLDSLFSVAEGAMSAEDALRRMVSELARAVAYGALLGQGPLGGLLGGASGGGLIGSIFGASFGGGLAEGGVAQPWKEYIVGERGTEKLIMGGRGGRVVPSDNAFGGSARQALDVRVTVGWSRSADGNLRPFVESVSQETVAGAAPTIISASAGEVDRKLSKGEMGKGFAARHGLQQVTKRS